jgi:steroid 5-alpha reductase family enzyme
VLYTFLWIWAACLSGGCLLWAVSVARRDVSLVDIFWGPGFLVATLIAWWRGGQASAWHHLLLAMVAVWALRLAAHIAWRGRGHGEDRRYAAMRKKNGSRFWWLSLFTVFSLQATLVTILCAPLAIVQLRPVVHPIWCLAGCVAWTVGFLFEAVADAQLLAFQRDPASRGRVLDSGLWRYSRHPNYFGEALLWWGFGAFALGVAGGAWTLYAPLVTTFLLLRVSGVPMLEAGMASRRPGYREYVERTSSFFPRPPRRSGGTA